MAGGGGLDFAALRSARLDKIGQAAEEWRTQARRLEEEMQGTAEEMASKARRANWKGENAAVTVPFVLETAEQFTAALKQARSLAQVIEDGYLGLRRCQAELETVVADAESQYLLINSTGFVSHPASEYAAYMDDSDRERITNGIRETTSQIEDILRRATEIDTGFAQALRDIVGSDSTRFNPVDYDSLREARRAHADAQAALSLICQGDELTDAEIRRLNSLLAQHADDPTFAETIATDLGADGTLQFWTDITGSRDLAPNTPGLEPSQRRMFATLQENLGLVLGTATQSDSQAMDRWETSITRLGSNDYGDGDTLKGFQVMSSLMRHGEFGNDFLIQYGDALIDYERESEMVWGPDPYHPLNFASEKDPGGDPMVGLLQALGRNPEASVEFFAPPSDFDPTPDNRSENKQINEELNYLVNERIWPPDYDPYAGPMPTDPGPIHESLGNALVAATTGYSSDALNSENPEEMLSSGDRRSAESARVMEQVMHLFGTKEPTLLAEQPAMAESLGAMAGMYMDNINYWVSDQTETGRELNSHIFRSPYGERLENGHFGTVQFLTVLGKDETAHEIVTQAQQYYTLGNLDRFPPDNPSNLEAGSETLNTAAEVRGILDYARVEQVKADLGADTEAAQEALGQTSGWTKAATGAAVGTGVALVSAAGGAGLAVPIAAGAAGVFLGEFINQNVDSGFQYEGNLHRQSNMTETEFYNAGVVDVSSLTDVYMSVAKDGVGVDEVDNSLDDMSGAYLNGQGYAANHGW